MTPEQLKASILQYAIQGKLVEQRPEDGTAEELYRQIQAQKQQLMKEGKIKKEKPLAEITEDELPFDIPERWKWVRLKDIVYSNGQKKPDSIFSYIDIGSIDNVHQKLNSEEKLIQANEAPSRARKIIKYGDIIYSTVRPYLHNICIIDKEFSAEPIASTGFAVFTCLKGIYNKYLFYYLLSPEFDTYANATENAKGVAYPAINDNKLYKAVVPIPPLAEQHRIVAKIEEMLPLVERYAVSYEELEKLNAKFPEDMKKSILQYAIQGKLVEQRPEEGTADELYRQIQAQKQQLMKEGKIKKEKPLAEITEAEIPFDIPESWKWVRLRDICTKIVDGDHNPPAGTREPSEYLMLSATNINQDTLVELSKVRYLTKEVYDIENQRTNVNINDIFFTIVGSMGRSCVYKGGYNICFQRSVSVISTEIFPEYLKRVLDTPYIQNFMNINATGTLQKGFYLKQVENLVIPLSPLAEQKRIVQKINQLLPYCHQLIK